MQIHSTFRPIVSLPSKHKALNPSYATPTTPHFGAFSAKSFLALPVFLTLFAPHSSTIAKKTVAASLTGTPPATQQRQITLSERVAHFITGELRPGTDKPRLPERALQTLNPNNDEIVQVIIKAFNTDPVGRLLLWEAFQKDVKIIRDNTSTQFLQKAGVRAAIVTILETGKQFLYLQNSRDYDRGELSNDIAHEYFHLFDGDGQSSKIQEYYAEVGALALRERLLGNDPKVKLTEKKLTEIFNSLNTVAGWKDLPISDGFQDKLIQLGFIIQTSNDVR